MVSNLKTAGLAWQKTLAQNKKQLAISQLANAQAQRKLYVSPNSF